jgi:hypothetical protein
MARNHPSNRKNRRSGPGNSVGPKPDTAGEEYKVGPGYPPKEFQFKPGQSGNPKGAKRKKPSIALGLRALFERALSKKVRLRQGEKERLLSSYEAGAEHFAHQFAKGDRHARRDLPMMADTVGSNLREPKAIEETLTSNHQAILDAYVARQNDMKAPPRSSPVFAPPELLDDDSENPRPK